jgi:hypothetical protein
VTNHFAEEISISIFHWESGEDTGRLTFLVWINESQRSLPILRIISFAKRRSLPILRIISFAKWKTNLVLGG